MDNFKLDTKEKFNVVTPKTDLISDNTAGALRQILEKQLRTDTKNVIINLSEVQHIDPKSCELLADMSSQYMETNASFVICGVNPSVKKVLDQLDLSDFLNITPTESEAWDIVQMEEIERELFSDEEEESI